MRVVRPFLGRVDALLELPLALELGVHLRAVLLPWALICSPRLRRVVHGVLLFPAPRVISPKLIQFW